MPPNPAAETATPENLGEFLRSVRDACKMTLREVEEASDVSNAYLSQLENGKITKPSPHILHKLAQVYRVPYELLMERAGYITRSPAATKAGSKSRNEAKAGRLPTFAQQDLTPAEEEELFRYLAFLRARKTK